MIIVSQDMRLMQRADIIIDLGNKPKPNVLYPKKDVAPEETESPKSGSVQ